jgi:hypothetical protein
LGASDRQILEAAAGHRHHVYRDFGRMRSRYIPPHAARTS